jgi:hypothetical protein
MALAKPRYPCTPYIEMGQETNFLALGECFIACYLFCRRYRDIILVRSGVLVQIE